MAQKSCITMIQITEAIQIHFTRPKWFSCILSRVFQANFILDQTYLFILL